MDRLLTPPHRELTPDSPARLAFLAGPIQGAPDWQTPTARELLAQNEFAYVASPRRLSGKEEGFVYTDQVEWEKRHLRRAASMGAIGFWFAAQDFTLPYEEGRAYGQTTRFEFGRVFGWADYDATVRDNLVVGVDPKYTPSGGGSERYITHMCGELGINVQTDLDAFTKELARILR